MIPSTHTNRVGFGPLRNDGDSLSGAVAAQPANCCCQFFVFWATTTDPVTAERMMIDEFHRRVGRLPFANRCRGSATRI